MHQNKVDISRSLGTALIVVSDIAQHNLADLEVVVEAGVVEGGEAVAEEVIGDTRETSKSI